MFDVNVSTSIYSDVSNKTLFVPVRSGRSAGPFGRAVGPPEEEKGIQHMFFLFQKIENCFSRAASNLFDIGNQSIPTHLASNVPFGSFQCSLEGGYDTPHTWDISDHYQVRTSMLSWYVDIVQIFFTDLHHLCKFPRG